MCAFDMELKSSRFQHRIELDLEMSRSRIYALILLALRFHSHIKMLNFVKLYVCTMYIYILAQRLSYNYLVDIHTWMGGVINSNNL